MSMALGVAKGRFRSTWGAYEHGIGGGSGTTQMNVGCLRAWHWGWLRDDLDQRGVLMSMALGVA